MWKKYRIIMKKKKQVIRKMKVRLNKYLNLCGLGSRRKVEELVTGGRVTVNNRKVTDLATTIDTDTDQVKLDGAAVKTHNKELTLILNKPKGYITTMSDEKGRPTVMALIPEKYIKAGVVPVGRLDKDTEGLLLLTNDGDMSYRLTRPDYKVSKEYIVELDKPLEVQDKTRIEKGFFVHQIKIKTRPAIVTLADKTGRYVKVIISEGKKRQIRYTFKNLGYKVLKLKRTGYGPLTLGRLHKGDHRELKANELKLLKKSAGIT
jgi:pseudouridine synthase